MCEEQGWTKFVNLKKTTLRLKKNANYSKFKYKFSAMLSQWLSPQLIFLCCDWKTEGTLTLFRGRVRQLSPLLIRPRQTTTMNCAAESLSHFSPKKRLFIGRCHPGNYVVGGFVLRHTRNNYSIADTVHKWTRSVKFLFSL